MGSQCKANSQMYDVLYVLIAFSGGAKGAVATGADVRLHIDEEESDED